MIQPVILWTDALIFLLLAAVTAFFVYARRQPHLRDPLRRVAQSRVGMVSMVVLAAYVAVGLLDSLHYRPALPGKPGAGVQYAVETLSVLDRLAAPLRERNEKTYSAPFATHAYAKEVVELPDGREVRDFPRLKYGGAHLNAPEAWLSDVLVHTLKAATLALAAWLLAALALCAWLAHRSGGSLSVSWRAVWRGETPVPWRAGLLTLGLLFLLVFPAVMLSTTYHILGTDKVGQDVFFQTLKSVRTGLVIGTLTTLVMLPFAVLLGIMAGYFRGWIDDVIQYLYTTLNSIPGVLLIAAAVLMMQVWMESNPDLFDTVAARADARLFFLCAILGVTSWTGLCRLLRGEALKLREMDYIQAAHAFGVSHWRIIGRHLLPNVMHIVLITVVMDFSGLVLAEAVLSYVGVGVDPTMQSWGNMINSARLEMARDPMVWWTLAAAFLFMFALVLFANLFADTVRDAFDPRTRR